MSYALALCSSASGFLINSDRSQRRRGRDLSFNHGGLNSVTSAHKIALQFAASQSLLHLSMSRGMQKNLAVFNSAPGAPLPPASPSGSLNGWILGIVVSVILPILTKKYGGLGGLMLKFKNMEAAVDGVERIVDVVEKVAEQVEEVAEDILDDLPSGNLKDVVSVIEHAAERTGDGAEAVGDLIDKVQEIGEKVESFVESGNDIEESKNQKQVVVAITDEADKEITGQPKLINKD